MRLGDFRRMWLWGVMLCGWSCRCCFVSGCGCRVMAVGSGNGWWLEQVVADL